MSLQHLQLLHMRKGRVHVRGCARLHEPDRFGKLDAQSAIADDHAIHIECRHCLLGGFEFYESELARIPGDAAVSHGPDHGEKGSQLI
jgi:hypothetical protein